MRFTWLILAAAVVGIALFVSASHVLSRSPEPAIPAAAVVPQPPAPSPAAVAPGEKSIIGVLEKYDPATRQLVLDSGKTTLTFHVAHGATVRRGLRSLKTDELAAHRGLRVKLRYSEAQGDRQVAWIVLAPSQRSARSTLK